MTLDDDIDRSAALADACRIDEALLLVDDILLRHPTSLTAKFNRAAALNQIGRHAEAVDLFDNVVNGCSKIDGSESTALIDKAKFGRGFGNVALGKYREGFYDLEFRRRQDLPLDVARKPQWCGGEISGKTILVIGEMGFGDNIMFSRYLSILVGMGADVLVVTPPPLRSLLRTISGVRIYNSQSFDCWCYIMSLAHLLGTEVDSVPPPSHFDLSLSASRVADWRQAVERAAIPGNLKIGLCWATGIKSTFDVHRSVALTQMRPIFDVQGIDIFSLQVGVRDSDKAAFDEFPLYDSGSKLRDFLDTACLLRNLDIIITVDTAVAHLAGSIGVQTWVMLSSYWTYWIWLRDSLWYPSARCFKQPANGDWFSVVKNIRQELLSFKQEQLR